MALFNRITIIGVGLIGGSLAKALKKRHLCKKVIGHFRNKAKLQKALRAKIVDEGYLSLDQAILNSDLVVLALPINHIVSFMRKIQRIKNKRILTIDVGSTKSQVTAMADKLNLDFVGTHPLAGSEKKGSDFSSGDLFVGSKVIITPTKNTSKKSLAKINRFWKKLGAQTITLSPEQHDKILAFISHLPHLNAFCLMNSIPSAHLKFSATGLKDSTRIALSDAEVWTDIMLSNKKALLTSINSFEDKLKKIKKAIQKNKRSELLDFITASKEKRERIE
jgi:prephenate dehydrogenase